MSDLSVFSPSSFSSLEQRLSADEFGYESLLYSNIKFLLAKVFDKNVSTKERQHYLQQMLDLFQNAAPKTRAKLIFNLVKYLDQIPNSFNFTHDILKTFIHNSMGAIDINVFDGEGNNILQNFYKFEIHQVLIDLVISYNARLFVPYAKDLMQRSTTSDKSIEHEQACQLQDYDVACKNKLS